MVGKTGHIESFRPWAVAQEGHLLTLMHQVLWQVIGPSYISMAATGVALSHHGP